MIISAYPEFLLGDVCSGLYINYLMANKFDALIGCFIGDNSYGKEKVSRFQGEYIVQQLMNPTLML